MNSQTSCLSNPSGTQPKPQAQRLLAINEQRKSGLILCKTHYAEFAGPGAIISTPVEVECTAIVVIGSPEIVEVVTHEERQKAYGRRIQWIRWLHKIAEDPDPLRRAEKLFFSFEAFYSRSVLAGLSDEVMALLVGVLPQTIATVRSQHRYPSKFDEHELISLHKRQEPSVLVLEPQALKLLSTVPTPFSVSSNFLATYSPLRRSA